MCHLLSIDFSEDLYVLKDKWTVYLVLSNVSTLDVFDGAELFTRLRPERQLKQFLNT